MSWNANHQSLLERFEAKYGLPAIDTESIVRTEEIARAWARQLAQQFKFTFPQQDWGTKRGDAGRPPSTDVICTSVPFVGYDVIIGQGTRGQKLARDPEPLHLTGQVFIDVEPFDWLGGTPVPAPSQPPSRVLSKPAAYAALQRLNAFYASQDGLQRPGGMVRHDDEGRTVADVEAMAQWFLQLVVEGASWADVEAQIRQSAEWRDKHPNG